MKARAAVLGRRTAKQIPVTKSAVRVKMIPVR